MVYLDFGVIMEWYGSFGEIFEVTICTFKMSGLCLYNYISQDLQMDIGWLLTTLLPNSP
jgi:hypothetical protein